MRILILTKDIEGGTGTFIESLIKLKNLNNKPNVFKLLSLKKPKYRSINKKFSYQNHKQPHIYNFSLIGIIAFLKEILWLRRKIKDFKPDVLIGICLHSNILIQIYKMIYLSNIPSILTAHINLNKTIFNKTSKITGYFLKFAVSYFYNRANAITTVSEGIKHSLIKDFKITNNILTIHLGVKNNNIKTIKKNKNNTIITLSRLDKQKDIYTLIKAFKMVKNKISNTKLWILGDGPLRKDLQNLTKRLELNKNVTFFKWKANTNKYLSKADIFVLSSFFEGFPYSILEAMNKGLPIISTNSPFGPAEIIKNNEYGILTPIKDKTILAEKILFLMKNNKAYENYSKKSLQRIKFFSEEKMISKYENLIKKAYER